MEREKYIPDEGRRREIADVPGPEAPRIQVDTEPKVEVQETEAGRTALAQTLIEEPKKEEFGKRPETQSRYWRKRLLIAAGAGLMLLSGVKIGEYFGGRPGERPQISGEQIADMVKKEVERQREFDRQKEKMAKEAKRPSPAPKTEAPKPKPKPAEKPVAEKKAETLPEMEIPKDEAKAEQFVDEAKAKAETEAAESRKEATAFYEKVVKSTELYCTKGKAYEHQEFLKWNWDDGKPHFRISSDGKFRREQYPSLLNEREHAKAQSEFFAMWGELRELLKPSPGASLVKRKDEIAAELTREKIDKHLSLPQRTVIDGIKAIIFERRLDSPNLFKDIDELLKLIGGGEETIPREE